MLRYIARTYTQKIFTAPALGTDAAGQLSYGPPAPLFCRQEGAEAVSRDRGTTNTVHAVLFSPSPIGPQDRIWLTGAPVSAVEAWIGAGLPDSSPLKDAADNAARKPTAVGCTPQYDLLGHLDYYRTEVG